MGVQLRLQGWCFCCKEEHTPRGSGVLLLATSNHLIAWHRRLLSAEGVVTVAYRRGLLRPAVSASSP